MPAPGPTGGFSLLELLIAMFLSALLVSGITALMGSSVSAYRQQLARGQLEESGRFAFETLRSHIAPAGYRHQPWQAPSGIAAVTGESVNGGSVRGDTLGLQRWSARNCYGHENPVRDVDGRARFHLLQTRFHVSGARNLAMTCRYGPDASQLTTQINNLGVIENVESMQVLFAEDRDGDGIADGWVRAADWQDESGLLAVRVALLLVSRSASFQAIPKPVTLLDETFAARGDGRLRHVLTQTTALRGRLK